MIETDWNPSSLISTMHVHYMNFGPEKKIHVYINLIKKMILPLGTRDCLQKAKLDRLKLPNACIVWHAVHSIILILYVNIIISRLPYWERERESVCVCVCLVDISMNMTDAINMDHTLLNVILKITGANANVYLKLWMSHVLLDNSLFETL